MKNIEVAITLINSKKFSIDLSKNNGGEGILQELANAYGENGEEIYNFVKKKKKTINLN